jgi:hypothetical protein
MELNKSRRKEGNSAKREAAHSIRFAGKDHHQPNPSGARRISQNRARAAADAYEARGEYEAALAALQHIPKTEAQRARLLRKISEEPAVLIEQTNTLVMHDTLQREALSRPIYHAYAALMIDSAATPQGIPANMWAESLFESIYTFLRTIGHLQNRCGDPIFGLRIIAQHKPKTPPTLSIALLVRTTAESGDEAHSELLELWSMLLHILPGNARQYFYCPVFDEHELTCLLRPFRAGHIAMITRRESIEDGEIVYHPFRPGNLDLHRLCMALLHHGKPAMLSVHLLPTTLMAWEQQTVRSPASDDIAIEGTIIRSDAADPFTRDLQSVEFGAKTEFAEWLLRGTADNTFAMQVYVASADKTTRLLAEQVATHLFGSSANTPFGGGSRVLYPRQEQSLTLLRNLDTLDIEQCMGEVSASPRLRHLFGEQEAVLAFRLPVPGNRGIPGLRMLEVKPALPPRNLPLTGIMLGRSVVRVGGSFQRITQSTDDRRRHTYVVGKTGTGKSTLMRVMAMQDIEQGHGICVIDPHGDLVEDILLRIPASRAQDVIIFDPADPAFPIGLNLLEHQNEQEKHIIVNEFIGLLKMLYDPHNMAVVGPRFQHNVRNAMLTAMSVPGSTLIEVVRVLTDSKYVRHMLPHVTDPIVRLYWEEQIANTADFHKSEVLDYIVSKFSNFVGDQRVRNIIGQSKTTMDMRALMDERKILLVNLSKGKMGPESAQFLGLLLVQRLLIAALGRANTTADNRPDFMLYVDEFQNFATPMFSTMLSEGRKYGLVITVANQYLSQLAQGTREAVMGNVGTFISFRVGLQDALVLAQEMQPVFQADDLINLPRYTTAVKLLLDGIAGDPFAMTTLPDWSLPDPRRAARIRRTSQKTYGRPEADVTKEILTRMLPPKDDALKSKEQMKRILGKL